MGIEAGLQVNPVADLVEMAGGLSKIEELQEDPSEKVYNKAMMILEHYFPRVEDDNDMDETGSTGFFGISTGFGAGGEILQGGFNFGGNGSFNFGGVQTPAFIF